MLIERASLDLGPGLTVLTGETGAGKSILLDGLGLALGDRADAAMVRNGAQQASASAEFRVATDHPARAFLAENDLPEDEPGSILLRRTLKADGGSRAYVNDVGVSAGLMRQLGALLVEINGQNDERGLLNPRGHMALLDAFAGHADLLAECAAAFARWAEARSTLAEAQARLESDQRDREWLEHSVAELAKLKPVAGEEAELAEARSNMQKGARLSESMDAIDSLLSSADGALSQLRQAGRRLERIAESDAELQAALDGVDRALVEGDAIESALAAVRERLMISPEALESAEARLFELRAMARKHRVEVEELPELSASLAARLQALEESGAGIEALTAAERAAESAYGVIAGRLGDARTAAAARLDAAVNLELPALKLEAARIRTAVVPATPGATGANQVRFEVATNAGTDFGPLTKIASGGEMSRFTLALKVVLARTGTAGTLIFDEIDRGVGGATASAIGERLARVADSAQVLVVTHSPQVAAAGVRHFRISKASGSTRIEPLEPEIRRDEIARMLSGAEITGEARAQADRLLAG